MRTRKCGGLYVLILLISIVFAMPAQAADLAAVDSLSDPGQPMDPMTGALGLADSGLQTGASPSINSQSDHQAQVYRVEGSVKILKSSTADWKAAEKGMRIGVGDQILTGPDSSVEIAYDDRFLNIARIAAGTKAEFESIEPTIVRLEDGSIFSALDGLKGSSYQVATPVAVAAVRGTHFEVNFEAATQKFNAAVLPDTREHISAVEITNAQGLSLLIKEGSEADLKDNVASEPRPIEPEKIQEAQAKLEALTDGVDPSLRVIEEAPEAPASETLEKKEGEGEDAPVLEDSSDENKKLPGGNDGGDLGGGGGEDADVLNSNSLLSGKEKTASPQDDSQVDAVMDSMIPSETVAASEENKSSEVKAAGESGKDSEDAEETGGGVKPSDSTPKPQGAPKADTETMVKFLNAGGAFEGEGASSGKLHTLFTNMKFDDRTSNVLVDSFKNPNAGDGTGGGSGRVVQDPITGPIRSEGFGREFPPINPEPPVIPFIDPRDKEPVRLFEPPKVELSFEALLGHFVNDGYRHILFDLLMHNQDNQNYLVLATQPVVNFTETNLNIDRPAGFSNQVVLKITKLDDVNGTTGAGVLDQAKVDYEIQHTFIEEGNSTPTSHTIASGQVTCNTADCTAGP